MAKYLQDIVFAIDRLTFRDGGTAEEDLLRYQAMIRNACRNLQELYPTSVTARNGEVFPPIQRNIDRLMKDADPGNSYLLLAAIVDSLKG